MRFDVRNVLTISVCLTSIFVFWFYGTFSSTQYSNHITWCLYLALCVTYLLPLYTIVPKSRFAAVFTIFASLFLLPRIALFLVDVGYEPLYSVWRYDYFNVTDFNKALTIILITSLAFYAGIWGAQHSRSEKKYYLQKTVSIGKLGFYKFDISTCKPWMISSAIIIVTLITHAVFTYRFFYEGSSALARGLETSNFSYFNNLITFFFSYNSITFLAVIMTFKYLGSAPQKYLMFGFIIITHTLTASMTGSRAASINVLLFMAIGFICTHDLRTKIRLSRLSLLLLTMFVITPFNVFMANKVRMCLIAERDVFSTFHYTTCISQIINYTSIASKPISTKLNQQNEKAVEFVTSAAYRLGAGLETFIIISSRKPGSFQEFLTFEYNLKNAVDVLVPGKPYLTRYNSAMILPFAFNVRDPKVFDERYHETFIMTIWGALTIMFSKNILFPTFLFLGFSLGLIENLKLFRSSKAFLPTMTMGTIMLSASHFFNMASFGDWLTGTTQFILFIATSFLLVLLCLAFLRQLRR